LHKAVEIIYKYIRCNYRLQHSMNSLFTEMRAF